MSAPTTDRRADPAPQPIRKQRERVFSGIKPTGTPTLGNYIGAIRHWVAEQDIYDNIFCVVDLHAITVSIEPRELRQNTRELAALLVACGIDPARSALFIQSHMPEHAELTWILDCVTPTGWLNRMIRRIMNGTGRREDIQMLVEVANKIEGHTICGLGDAAAWPVQSFVKHYRHEFEYMVDNGGRSMVTGSRLEAA